MRFRRPPNVLLVFLGLTILQPVLFVLVGALPHLDTRGIGFLLVLLIALAYRSRIGWGLLLVVDGVPLLAAASLSGNAVAAGGHLMWSHAVAMLVTGVALEAVLLSKPMRQYIRGGRQHAGSPMPSGGLEH